MRHGTACLRSLSALFLAILLSAAAQAQPSSAAAAPWTRIGPEGGAVLALAAAPSRSSTSYAGLQGGGVFRGTDGGGSWTYAGAGLGRGPAVHGLAVDAAQPGTVYALTDRGLYKSTNSGGSWSRMSPPGSAEHFPTALAADPRRSGVVYAALDGGGILASADRGRSWKPIGSLPDTAYLLAIDPVNTTTLYAGTRYSGVFKSTDAGAHWASITRGIHPAPAEAAAFAIDPRRPRTLFLSTFSAAPYRSVDGGGHWVQGGTGLGSQPNVRSLAVDPGSSAVFAGTPRDGVFRSTNRGVTWQRAGAGLPDPSVNALLATGGGLLAGSQAGVSLSRDRALTWRTGRGIKGNSVLSLAIDSQDPPRMYAFDGVHLLKSASRGASWVRLATPSDDQFLGPRGPVVVHPGDPRQIELGYIGVVVRSDDGGHEWFHHFGVGCVVPGLIVLDPNDAEVVYASGAFALGACAAQPNACDSFKLDHGQVACLRDTSIGPYGVHVIAVDPAASNHLFAGNGKLFHSTDAGATWSVLSAAIQPSVLLFDPVRSGTLYAGVYPGGVARSADGGATWQTATAGLPAATVVQSLAIDSTRPSTLYAATQLAVYRSTDSGATWAPLGMGLDEVLVDEIVLDPQDPAVLYAATWGGGVMRLRVGA